MPPVIETFETIGMATVAKSADEAKDLLFLRAGDGITMNRDRLLADAKAKALELAENYAVAREQAISLPGKTAVRRACRSLSTGFAAPARPRRMTSLSAEQLARSLSGGDTDMTETSGENDLLSLECRAFLALARQPASIARVGHMLKTGKPLRN